jgi:hypothetical protein
VEGLKSFLPKPLRKWLSERRRRCVSIARGLPEGVAALSPAQGHPRRRNLGSRAEIDLALPASRACPCRARRPGCGKAGPSQGKMNHARVDKPATMLQSKRRHESP